MWLNKINAGRGLPWPFAATLTPGDEFQTYTLTTALHVAGTSLRHLLIRPTDIPGATFEIESLRVVYRKEYLSAFHPASRGKGSRRSIASRSRRARRRPSR